MAYCLFCFLKKKQKAGKPYRGMQGLLPAQERQGGIHRVHFREIKPCKQQGFISMLIFDEFC